MQNASRPQWRAMSRAPSSASCSLKSILRPCTGAMNSRMGAAVITPVTARTVPMFAASMGCSSGGNTSPFCAPLLPAGGRDDAVHAQVLDHLSVVVEGVRDREAGQVQPRRFTANRLQIVVEILRGQRGRRLVADGEGVLEELDDVGLCSEVFRTVRPLHAL